MGKKKNHDILTKIVIAISLVMVLVFIGVYGDPHRYVIRDNLGNEWEPTGSNLVIAFQSLQENGELWLPSPPWPLARTITVTNDLCISKEGIKIHGGDSFIVFSNGSRLISSANPTSTSQAVRFSKGLDNIQLEDFTFTGDGQLEITLGNNTLVRNVKAEYTYCMRPGAFRFVLPSSVPKVSGLTVKNCEAYKVWWHGFQINAVTTNHVKIENVLFEDCISRYAGWEYEGRGVRTDANGNWSVGFGLAENYGCGSCITVENVTVIDCISEYSWESGFHLEEAPTKINVVFENCKSNHNGQKREYVDVVGKTYYCSGFIASTSGVTLKNCEANYNTRWGYYLGNLGNMPILINNGGTGNWEGLCNQGC